MDPNDTDVQEPQPAAPQPTPEQNTEQGDGLEAQLAAAVEAYRDAILQAYPDVVPELVAGSSIAEINASLERARNAYANVAARMRLTPSGVPAGSTGSERSGPQPLGRNAGGQASAIDLIKAGLRQK